MATEIKHRRGNSTEIAAFTPAVAEIVVNTDDNTMHLGDGVKQGGFKVPKVEGVYSSHYETLADFSTSTDKSRIFEGGRITIGDRGISNWSVIKTVDVVSSDYGFVSAVTGLSIVLVTTNSVPVEAFGLDSSGTGDVSGGNTDAINNAIMYAYKKSPALVATVSPWIHEVLMPPGVDFRMFGEVLIPSGITLNLNGGRLVGDNGSAGGTEYDTGGVHSIQSAYYDSGSDAFISNKGLPLNNKRVTNSKIINGGFINMNCPLLLTNMNEGCKLQRITVGNCSRAMNSEFCFYMQMEGFFVTQTAGLPNQIGIHYFGDAVNAVTHTNVTLSGCAVGIQFDSTTGLAVEWTGGCSFEGCDVGVLFSSGFLSGVKFNSCYFENTNTCIQLTNANIYGFDFNNNFVSNCEYTIKSAVNSIRLGTMYTNGISDGGGVLRNLVDLSAPGNDVIIQLPGIRGSASPIAHLGNILTNPACNVIAPYAWVDGTDAIMARTLSCGGSNDGKVTELPWDGRAMKTVNNILPYSTFSNVTTTVTRITTSVIYDRAQCLVFNYKIIDTAAVRNIHGFIFGDTVYRQDAGAEVITLNQSTAGLSVIIDINGVDSSSGFNIEGSIRHM